MRLTEPRDPETLCIIVYGGRGRRPCRVLRADTEQPVALPTKAAFRPTGKPMKNAVVFIRDESSRRVDGLTRVGGIEREEPIERLLPG